MRKGKHSMQDSQTMAHFLCGTGWSHVGALSFLKENMFAPPGDFSIFKRKHISPPGDFQFPSGEQPFTPRTAKVRNLRRHPLWRSAVAAEGKQKSTVFIGEHGALMML